MWVSPASLLVDDSAVTTDLDSLTAVALVCPHEFYAAMGVRGRAD
jgi:hypothetical protein